MVLFRQVLLYGDGMALRHRYIEHKSWISNPEEPEEHVVQT